MNRLQEKKQGQTVEQLAEHLKTAQSFILAELYQLKIVGCVEQDKDGVWTMVRG